MEYDDSKGIMLPVTSGSLVCQSSTGSRKEVIPHIRSAYLVIVTVRSVCSKSAKYVIFGRTFGDAWMDFEEIRPGDVTLA